MHNRILLIMLLFVTSFSVSAQFYTITKDKDVCFVETNQQTQISNIKADTIVFEAKKSPKDTTKVKKVVKLPKPTCDRKSNKSTSQVFEKGNSSQNLPELNIPNLITEIKRNNIKYPKVVLAQAILETGWFKSSVCRNKNNLFGLTNPRTGNYYEFNHWTESVRAYYTKVQYRYKGGNYLLWLRDIGYAEEPTYIQRVIKVMRML